MRLDKFLKVSRIIKRRVIANQACDSGKIIVNNKIAKAGLNLKIGDIIQIKFKNKTLKIKVLNLNEFVRASEVLSMYEIVAEETNKNDS